MDYLSTMHIPVWRLRRSLPGAKSSPLCYSAYAIYDDQGQLRAYWVLTMLTTPAQTQLMEKISTAVHDRLQGRVEPHEADRASLQHRIPVLAMGSAAAGYYQACAPITTHHPAALLQQPEYKAVFWQAIKALFKVSV